MRCLEHPRGPRILCRGRWREGFRCWWLRRCSASIGHREPRGLAGPPVRARFPGHHSCRSAPRREARRGRRSRPPARARKRLTCVTFFIASLVMSCTTVREACVPWALFRHYLRVLSTFFSFFCVVLISVVSLYA